MVLSGEMPGSLWLLYGDQTIRDGGVWQRDLVDQVRDEGRYGDYEVLDFRYSLNGEPTKSDWVEDVTEVYEDGS